MTGATAQLWKCAKYVLALSYAPSPLTDQLVQVRDKFRADHLVHFYASDVDVILSPSGPGPAPVLGTSKYWGYTSFYNLVDFPAGVLPTGDFVQESDVKDAEREYMSADDERIAAECEFCNDCHVRNG